MRLQFILSEIGIGLRRNLSMAISVVLVTMVSMYLLGSGCWPSARRTPSRATGTTACR